MKKITFIGGEYTLSDGVSRVMTLWGNYMIKKNIDVEIVSTQNGLPEHTLSGRVKYNVVHFKQKRKITQLFYIIYNTVIAYFFLKNRKDRTIVFNKAFYIEPIFILRKIGLFKKTKLIYFVHGGVEDFEKFYLSRRLVKHRVPMMFEAFDHIIALWDDNRKLPATVDRSKLSIIANPVTFDICPMKDEDKENIILFVGRVVYAKGVDILIDAWSNICQKYPDWKVYIVGEGEDRRALINKVTKLNISESIIFTGQKKNVEEYYRQSKIFVFPSSHAEGMPMVLLEAMACQTAIVASDIPAHRNLIDNTVTGFLKKVDTVLFEEAIEHLIINNNERKLLSEKAQQSLERYKIDDIFQSFNRII